MRETLHISRLSGTASRYGQLFTIDGGNCLLPASESFFQVEFNGCTQIVAFPIQRRMQLFLDDKVQILLPSFLLITSIGEFEFRSCFHARLNFKWQSSFISASLSRLLIKGLSLDFHFLRCALEQFLQRNR